MAMISPRTLPLGWRALATFFGSGLSPIMPGTCGSLAALVPLFFVQQAHWFFVLLLGTVVATALCVAIAQRLPRKADGGDPGWFVLDEAAGLWLAALPLSGPDPTRLLVTCALFRIFDMTKPPPLRWLERVGGGLGIVLDDLGAGVYALLTIWGWDRLF